MSRHGPGCALGSEQGRTKRSHLLDQDTILPSVMVLLRAGMKISRTLAQTWRLRARHAQAQGRLCGPGGLHWPQERGEGGRGGTMCKVQELTSQRREGRGKTEKGREGGNREGKGGETEKGREGKQRREGRGKTEKGREGKTEKGREGENREGKGGENREGKGGENREGKGTGKTEKGREGKTEKGREGENREGKGGGRTEKGKEGETEKGREGENREGKGGKTEKGREGKTEKGREGENREGKEGKTEKGREGENREGKGGGKQRREGGGNREGKGGENREGREGENREGREGKQRCADHRTQLCQAQYRNVPSTVQECANHSTGVNRGEVKRKEPSLPASCDLSQGGCIPGERPRGTWLGGPPWLCAFPLLYWMIKQYCTGCPEQFSAVRSGRGAGVRGENAPPRKCKAAQGRGGSGCQVSKERGKGGSDPFKIYRTSDLP